MLKSFIFWSCLRRIPSPLVSGFCDFALDKAEVATLRRMNMEHEIYHGKNKPGQKQWVVKITWGARPNTLKIGRESHSNIFADEADTLQNSAHPPKF